MGRTAQALQAPKALLCVHWGTEERAMRPRKNQSSDRRTEPRAGLVGWVRGLLLSTLLLAPGAALGADDAEIRWKRVENRVDAGREVTVFEQAEPTPGRPAFRIETILDAKPSVAAAELRQEMLSENDVPRGQTRKILTSRGDESVVHTFLDLPLMLADREIALRLVSSIDSATGTHRVDWNEANEMLPPAASGVVRLQGTRGYWEFKPEGAGLTRAVYQSQTEIGGSFPVSLGDRMMKGQAIDAVSRLRTRIERRLRTHVASDRPKAP